MPANDTTPQLDAHQSANLAAFLRRFPAAEQVSFALVAMATLADPDAMRKIPPAFWTINPATGSLLTVGGRRK